MSTDDIQGGQSMLGHGHYTNGQWYCECHRVAYCRTIQKGKPYAGEKCALRLILPFHSRKANFAYRLEMSWSQQPAMLVLSLGGTRSCCEGVVDRFSSSACAPNPEKG